MIVRWTQAGVVPPSVLHTARVVAAGGRGARVARIHLAVVARVASRAVAGVPEWWIF